MKRLRLFIPMLAAAGLIIIGGSAASAESADRAARTFRDCRICPEMVIVPPGTFVMGSPETEKDRDNDEGQHKVTIAYSFAVSKGPITWDQWEACVRDAMCDGKAVEAALRLDRDGKPIQTMWPWPGRSPGSWRQLAGCTGICRLVKQESRQGEISPFVGIGIRIRRSSRHCHGLLVGQRTQP